MKDSISWMTASGYLAVHPRPRRYELSTLAKRTGRERRQLFELPPDRSRPHGAPPSTSRTCSRAGREQRKLRVRQVGGSPQIDAPPFIVRIHSGTAVMQRRISARQLSKMLLRAMILSLLAALFGVLLALSAGSHVDAVRMKVGAVLVMASIALAVVLTPIGVVINLGLMYQEMRDRRHARDEEVRSLLAHHEEERSATSRVSAEPTTGQPVDQRQKCVAAVAGG